jgi:predicted DNA-binding transcriptional regulator AlpA
MTVTDTNQPQRHHLDRHAGDIAQFVALGDPDELLPSKVVCKLVHVSEQTLDVWRARTRAAKTPEERVGPPFVPLGPRLVRYRRGDLVEWLRSRTQQMEVPKPKTQAPKKGSKEKFHNLKEVKHGT